MKKLFLFALVVAATITMEPAKNNSEIYPTTGIVIETNFTADVVTVETFSGLQYEFSGVEDWELGDICSMLMNDSSTPDSVLDDEILQVRYSGYIKE